MSDEIMEIQKEIAYRHWQLTGADEKANWDFAGKVILHFVNRRTNDPWWVRDEEDFSIYADLIYADGREGNKEPDPA